MKWGPLTFQEHAEEAAPGGERSGKVRGAQGEAGRRWYHEAQGLGGQPCQCGGRRSRRQ